MRQKLTYPGTFDPASLLYEILDAEPSLIETQPDGTQEMLISLNYDAGQGEVIVELPESISPDEIGAVVAAHDPSTPHPIIAAERQEQQEATAVLSDLRGAFDSALGSLSDGAQKTAADIDEATADLNLDLAALSDAQRWQLVLRTVQRQRRMLHRQAVAIGLLRLVLRGMRWLVVR